ncbi:MAG: site-specific integrase [Bacteroidota bacterium]|nr:site-specific integrase [Bacteroidota bacterium]
MIPTVHLQLMVRREKKDGTYPVKIRVVYQRLYHDYRTGIDLTEETFKNAMSEKCKEPFRKTRAKLDAVKVKADKIIEDLKPFTFPKFESEFYGRVKDASDIYPVFQDYIDKLRQEGRLKTATGYQTAMNSFKKFDRTLGFYDITADWLKKYQRWLIEDGNSETTVGIYTRYLRAIFNQAISIGILKKDETYPFGKRQFIIPAGKNVKKALTLKEVKSIIDYDAVPGSPEDKARDFWMFSYLCNGINFKDIAMLRQKNIDGDMLRLVRSKTRNSTRANQSVISIFLSRSAKDIIKKWKNKKKNGEEYLFDILSIDDDVAQDQAKIDQFIKITNKYMKRICEELVLGKVITTYYARHSAATILKKSGASVEQIREALGHQSTGTTQKYLDSFDDDTKKELAKALTNF